MCLFDFAASSGTSPDNPDPADHAVVPHCIPQAVGQCYQCQHHGCRYPSVYLRHQVDQQTCMAQIRIR